MVRRSSALHRLSAAKCCRRLLNCPLLPARSQPGAAAAASASPPPQLVEAVEAAVELVARLRPTDPLLFMGSLLAHPEAPDAGAPHQATVGGWVGSTGGS